MDDQDAIDLDADERDAFLGSGGTGVLAFADSSTESPHAIPVSYGYDPTASVFYFRLAVGPDSEKGDVADRPVTFVTYGQRDDDWHSVVAKGSLSATTEESVATDSLAGLREVHIPLVDVFGTPPKDVPFEFYRLDPETLTGRVESSTAL